MQACVFVFSKCFKLFITWSAAQSEIGSDKQQRPPTRCCPRTPKPHWHSNHLATRCPNMPVFDGGHWSSEKALQWHGTGVEWDLYGLMHQQQSFYWAVVVKRVLSPRAIYQLVFKPSPVLMNPLNYFILRPSALRSPYLLQCGFHVLKGCMHTLRVGFTHVDKLALVQMFNKWGYDL